MEFVHLNAIKAGWGSAAGTVTKVTLVKPYVEEELRAILLRNDMEKYLYALTGER